MKKLQNNLRTGRPFIHHIETGQYGVTTCIGQRLEMDAEGFEIDADNPDDLSFWAEQFQISKQDLRQAITVAGPNVEAITHYLQR